MVTDGFDIEDFDRMAAKQKHDLADSVASEEQLFSYRKKPFLN